MDSLSVSNEELVKELDRLREENKQLKNDYENEIKLRLYSESELSSYIYKSEYSMKSLSYAWWEMDILSGKVKFSPNKAEMLGYEPSRFKHYQDFTTFIHPADYDEAMNAMQVLIHGDADKYDVVYRILASDGNYRYFHDVGIISRRDKNGKPLIVSGTNQDITNLKKAEEAIKEASLFNYSLLNSIPARVFWKDRNLCYLGCNNAILADADLESEEQIVGKNDYDMPWHQFAEQYRSDDLEVIESGKAKLLIEEPLIIADGSHITLLTSKIPMQNANGEITGIIGIFFDITDKKVLEQELANSENALKKGEEIAKYGHWKLYLNKSFMASSEGASKIYGLDKTESNLDQVKRLALPAYRPILDKALFDAVHNGVPYNVEFKIKRESDGEVVDIHSIAEFDSENNILFGTIQDITEHKKIEEALLQSNKKWEAIIQASPDGIGIASLDGKIQLVSQKLIEMHGYSKEQSDIYLGRSVFEFIDASSQPLLIDNFRKLLSGEKGNKVSEYIALKKDGSKFDVDVNSALVLDSDGNPLNILYLERDISERKKAEKLLRESEEKLELFFSQSLDGFFFMMLEEPIHWNDEVDKDKLLDYVFANQHITKINNAILEQYRANREQFMNLTPNDLFAHDLDYGKGVWRQFFDSGKLHIETNERRLDGTLMWVEGDYICLYDNENRITGHFGIQRDVTERKLAVQSLILSEEKYRMIAENTSDVIWVLNVSKDKFTYISPSIINLRGLTVEEALNEKMTDSMAPESFEMVQSKIESAIKGNPDFHKSDTIAIVEIQQPHKDGSLIWVEAATKLSVNSDGDIEVLGVSRNINERKMLELERQQAEDMKSDLLNSLKESNQIIEANLYQKTAIIEELENTKDKLQQINSEKDKFFSIIAHDLKSPFSGFLGLTKMMSENISNFSLNELQNISSKMKQSADNIYELLENLLAWSRMQRGLIEFEPVPCNLGQLAKHNIGIIENFASQKNISVTNSIPKNLTIVADESMLNTILRNLISNALKFTPKGGKIEIGSVINPSEGYTVIYVKDNGIGMGKEMIEKIFSIGQNVSRTGTENEPSTGLGLLLCEEFIVKHNGKIWVESEVGIGSTFYFAIPTNTENKGKLD